MADWHDPEVIIPAGIAWTGAMLAGIRALVHRAVGAYDQRQTATDVEVKDLTKDLRKLERELLELKADLPLSYYRREDMIRFETVMHAKLDALASNIQQLECRKCPTTP